MSSNYFYFTIEVAGSAVLCYNPIAHSYVGGTFALRPKLDEWDNSNQEGKMKPNIGISGKNLNGSVDILNQLLADEYLLYTKTRNYHWNVEGQDFSELHKFFESQYEELDEIIDEVAERARSMGGKALGTLKEFLAKTKLKEFPANYPSANKMISNLLADHESIIQGLRQSLEICNHQYKDMGTSDFLTGLMEQHEKMTWMLRSY